MTADKINVYFQKIVNYTDWHLLLFLLLFLNVKLEVKIIAIILIYLLRFNFKFGFQLRGSRIPLFYLLIIVIAFAGMFISKGSPDPNYLPVFLTGIAFWALCILAVHQVKLSVENTETKKLHRTVLVFFIVNIAFSLLNIALIIRETGAINPYRYQGEYQKYFIGTGDHIRGLTFDTSTTNAVINAFGVVYFLIRKNAVMMLACMAILLLTGSNFTNIIVIAILTGWFIFKTEKDQKSIIVICIMLLVVFMVKISPQNNGYVTETFKNTLHPQVPPFTTIAIAKKTDSVPTDEDLKRAFAKRYLDSLKYIQNQKMAAAAAAQSHPLVKQTDAGRIYVAGPDINTPPYQTPTDTTAEQQKLLDFINGHKSALPLSAQVNYIQHLPGKAIAMLQTISFLRQHPLKMFIGAGLGHFSSKLAFRTTGLGFAGGYPAKHIYIDNDFLSNHLDVYLNFFSKRVGLHSLTNSPFSVYDQLLAEYGLLGLAAFAIFYLGSFARHYKQLTYGIPLLLIMLAAFFIDYWFEQLSVLVVFELLLLINIKETDQLKPANNG